MQEKLTKFFFFYFRFFGIKREPDDEWRWCDDYEKRKSMSVFVSFEVLRNSQKMDLTVLFTASKSRLIRNHNQNGICLVCSLGDKDHQGYILVWVSRVWFLSIYGESTENKLKVWNCMIIESASAII